MSADLEKLKEFLLHPLFDQDSGIKGFLNPPLVDEQTYVPKIGGAETAKAENAKLRKGITRLRGGVKNQNCEFVIDLVVLMRRYPNFAPSSLNNLAKTSFDYAKDLFERSGFSFDKIILADPDKITSIKRNWGELDKGPFLDVLNKPGFLSYGGEVLVQSEQISEESTFSKELSDEAQFEILREFLPHSIHINLLDTKGFLGKVAETVFAPSLSKDIQSLRFSVKEIIRENILRESLKWLLTRYRQKFRAQMSHQV